MNQTATQTRMSISISPVLAEFVMRYCQRHKQKSKSAVIESALELLRHEELKRQFKVVMSEALESGEIELYDGTVGDGLARETW